MSKPEPETFEQAWFEFTTAFRELCWNIAEALGLKKILLAVGRWLSKKRR